MPTIKKHITDYYGKIVLNPDLCQMTMKRSRAFPYLSPVAPPIATKEMKNRIIAVPVSVKKVSKLLLTHKI